MENNNQHKWNNILRPVYERLQYGCMHVTHDTRGVTTSQKHSSKDAQTRLQCVFNTPPGL